MRFCALGLSGSAALLLLTSSAQAQEVARSGQVSDSAVGQVGLLQTAENRQAQIEPMGRPNHRNTNRLKNLTHTPTRRIYLHDSNAMSPITSQQQQHHPANP